ncbi:hypothetical protein U3516DRAFT_745198 [Neocallimastix sp. 'constans']
MIISIASRKSDTEKVKLLIDYATKNRIRLKLNNRESYLEFYPLLIIAIDNDTETVQLLIDYITKNKNGLELNGKPYNNCTPITLIMCHNNLEIFKILMEYSLKKKGIKLIIDENDIKEEISKNKYDINYHLKNITEIDSEILKLINLYRNKNKIKVIFSDNSYFIKVFNELNIKKGKDEELKDRKN